jgi:uronate dehydrogenase
MKRARAMHILLTGAAGGVGQMLRPYFSAAGIQVRLSDMQAIGELRPNETFVLANLNDTAALEKIVAGVDGIVHLGGHSVEGPWETILESNIEGCYHLYEAARIAAVPRIVFASTNHTMGFYPRSEKVGTEKITRPDSRYGVSKVFGEALGALYSDKFGLRITNIRIGNVGFEPIDRRRLSIWLHPEDLFQLVMIGMQHADIRYETIYGMSNNVRGWWDNQRARALGYVPKHASEDFAAKILARDEPVDTIADQYQGGAFCAMEYAAKARA